MRSSGVSDLRSCSTFFSSTARSARTSRDSPFWKTCTLRQLRRDARARATRASNRRRDTGRRRHLAVRSPRHGRRQSVRSSSDRRRARSDRAARKVGFVSRRVVIGNAEKIHIQIRIAFVQSPHERTEPTRNLSRPVCRKRDSHMPRSRTGARNNFRDDIGRAVAREMRRQTNPAAVLKHDRALRQLVFAVLRALHVDVRTNAVEQHFRRAFCKSTTASTLRSPRRIVARSSNGTSGRRSPFNFRLMRWSSNPRLARRLERAPRRDSST